MDPGPIVRRSVELLGWVGVGSVGFVMLTQTFGWNGNRIVATLQALTPYGIPVVLAIAAVAVALRREALATVGALVGVGAFLLSTPLVVPPGQRPPIEGATGLSVASVNLLYSNPVVDEAADLLLDVDADVIVFTEFTIGHAEELARHPLSARYPHQINRDGLAAGGIAVWSKFASVENERPDTVNYTIDASISGPDSVVRLLAVHPPTPVFDFDGWVRDLDLIGRTTTQIAQPTLVVGDFNASFWHPAFRDLLRLGLTDAHLANGDGWSTSWPTDQALPPFVRLDHALTGNGLVSTGIDDFRVPGSDHAGFVVDVTPSG